MNPAPVRSVAADDVADVADVSRGAGQGGVPPDPASAGTAEFAPARGPEANADVVPDTAAFEPDRAVFEREWAEWQQGRLGAATAPTGPAALVLTQWVTGEEPRAVAGLPGLWSAPGGVLTATAFAPGDYTLPTGEHAEAPLRLGEPRGDADAGAHAEVRAGTLTVRPFAREGVPAVRVFDPAAPGRTGLESIDAFAPDPAWVVPARFDPRPRAVPIELADGHQTIAETSGDLVFELAGVEHRLAGTVRGGAISVVFGDATNGVESYGFRFLTVPAPDATGRTAIDFNRSYLPPCAFSDQFVCPLPAAGNRLPVRIAAGEREVRRSAEPSAEEARTRRYRDVMGAFPSGVTIVTTQGDAGPVGFTCQSFYSVSITPPLVSFSISRSSKSLAAVRKSGRVVINFLSAAQRHLSAQFARSGTDKWQGVAWTPAVDNGSPVLDEVTGWVAGEIDREIEAGDHLIFLVRVDALHTAPDVEPLVFHRGSYRELEYMI